MLREHPWHRPTPTTEHEQRFRNLMGLHRLTTTWLKDLDMDENSTTYQLRRVAGPEVRSHLQKLAEITKGEVPRDLESLIDAVLPEEFLQRFEYTIWALQAWTLRNILERTSPGEHPALRNLIEQSSWKAGRRCAEERWPDLPGDAVSHAGGILAALRDSPLSGYPDPNALLVRRSTAREVEVELLACPHRTPYLEVLPAADDLCAYHAHWIRGFVYGLNTLMSVEYRPQNSARTGAPDSARAGASRCSIRVHLLDAV